MRLPFETPEAFLQRYGQHLSKGGIYLRAKALRAPGTPVTLEVKLQNGQRVLFGAALVAFVTGNKGGGVPGMGFKFITLDGPSRRFLESAAAAMPHARSNEVPVPKGVGPTDSSPTAVEPPAPPPSQPQPDLPSMQAGRMYVSGDSSAGITAPVIEAPIAEAPRTGPIVGIDLGTSNSAVAIVRDGKPTILHARDGQPLVPSVVAVTPGGKLVVGKDAKALLLTNPRMAVSGFKRLLGRPFDSPDVQEIIDRFGWEVVATDIGDCAAKLAGHVYRLEEICAVVLKDLREIASLRLGRPVHRAVITVPAWYNEKQRESVREAGQLAGLYVERIVSEPTAAALSYGYGKKFSRRVLVYDLGGGTFDASVLELNDNVYEVVSTGGNNFLGGIDFDQSVVAWARAEFEKKHHTVFTDRVALARVADAAEKAKIQLSSLLEAKITVPFVTMVAGKPLDLDLLLTRTRLSDLTRHLVDRTVDVCQEVLLSRNLRADQIDEIVLVGGQTRAPLVHERVTLLIGRRPVAGVNPEEAVAMGAALLASALETKEGLLLIDALPMSIGVALPGGRYHPVIMRNSPLPSTRKYQLSTTRDGQAELEINVLQGEEATARQNSHLGTLVVTGLPEGPRGTVSVEVTFELDADCLLKLTAKELSQGRELTALFATRDTPAEVKARLAKVEAEPPEPARPGLLSRFFG